MLSESDFAHLLQFGTGDKMPSFTRTLNSSRLLDSWQSETAPRCQLQTGSSLIKTVAPVKMTLEWPNQTLSCGKRSYAI